MILYRTMLSIYHANGVKRTGAGLNRYKVVFLPTRLGFHRRQSDQSIKKLDSQSH